MNALIMRENQTFRRILVYSAEGLLSEPERETRNYANA